MDDAHFNNRTRREPGEYTLRPVTASEHDFLSLGSGAKAWLYEAGENGATTIDRVVETAVQLAERYSSELVDRALGQAATFARFSPADIESIAVTLLTGGHDQARRRADAEHSLNTHTSAWEGFTTTVTPGQTPTPP